MWPECYTTQWDLAKATPKAVGQQQPFQLENNICVPCNTLQAWSNKDQQASKISSVATEEADHTTALPRTLGSCQSQLEVAEATWKLPTKKETRLVTFTTRWEAKIKSSKLWISLQWLGKLRQHSPAGVLCVWAHSKTYQIVWEWGYL